MVAALPKAPLCPVPITVSKRIDEFSWFWAVSISCAFFLHVVQMEWYSMCFLGIFHLTFFVRTFYGMVVKHSHCAVFCGMNIVQCIYPYYWWWTFLDRNSAPGTYLLENIGLYSLGVYTQEEFPGHEVCLFSSLAGTAKWFCKVFIALYTFAKIVSAFWLFF